MPELSDGAIEAARRQGDEVAAAEPRAASARYDASTGRVTVELTNGCSFAFPARALQGLEDASDTALAEVEVLGAGLGLHWESLDADFTVPGLMTGLFGTRAWMAREQASLANYPSRDRASQLARGTDRQS